MISWYYEGLLENTKQGQANMALTYRCKFLDHITVVSKNFQYFWKLQIPISICIVLFLKWGHCLSSLSTLAIESTPDNKSTRPVSAPVMSPVSPGEATPSPLLPTLFRSDCHDGSTPKDRRPAHRKAEAKPGSQPPEYTKSHSRRPESTPEIKVIDTILLHRKNHQASL